VPVVLPAHGTFPELIEDTGGGILHEPENPQALAVVLRQMILDPAAAARQGLAAQQAIRDRYNDDVMARRTLDLYRSLVRNSVPERAMQP
jgi:glycosyltransferase involved in cell wall biosynthesis